LAEQTTAAKDVLEETEEQFDDPAMPIDVGDHFGGRVEQVGGDANDAIARRSRGAALAAAALLVRRRRDLHHPHRMIRMLFVRA